MKPARGPSEWGPAVLGGSSGRPCGRVALCALEQSLLAPRWARRPGTPPKAVPCFRSSHRLETPPDAADAATWSRRVSRTGRARRPQTRRSRHRDFAPSTSATPVPGKGPRPAALATREPSDAAAPAGGSPASRTVSAPEASGPSPAVTAVSPVTYGDADR